MDLSGRNAEIKRWVNKNAERIVELVGTLVRFNSVNHVTFGTEQECQFFIADQLRKCGMEVDIFSPEAVEGLHEHPAYFPGKDYSDRPNVIGVKKGKGVGKSLIFSSHADTTAASKGWSHDPWKPRIKNNRLYGLGAFDMKGGLAASIMAVQCLSELGIQLQGDILIESVVDEEFGGANGTLAGRIKGYNPDAAIIPEPTNMAICPAARGGALWRVSIYGTTGMSFSGEKILDPVKMAAKFMTYLEEYEQERGNRPGPGPWYEHDSTLPVMITRIEAGDMTAPLCDTGPSACHVDIWVECHPGVSEGQLQQEIMEGFIQKYELDDGLNGYQIEFKKMIRFLPGTEIAPDFPLIDILAQSVKDISGSHPQVHGAPFACDAFMFNLFSPTPAIIMGPVGANAHSADEYIEIPELLQLVEVYADAASNWCGCENKGVDVDAAI